MLILWWDNGSWRCALNCETNVNVSAFAKDTWINLMILEYLSLFQVQPLTTWLLFFLIYTFFGSLGCPLFVPRHKPLSKITEMHSSYMFSVIDLRICLLSFAC